MRFVCSFRGLLTAACILFFTPCILAQPVYYWSGQLGGTGGDFGYSITADGSGNTYSTGIFNGTADLDPGSGTANFTSFGASDIYISKLDASGNFVWAKQLGGGGNDYGYAIASDAAGNVFITGYFDGAADFDPGPGTFSLTPGGYDVFICKLDAAGSFVWAVQLGGPGTDYGNSIALDPFGNIITTGYFTGTGDFDPGPGTSNMTSAGGNDVFVSKLGPSGNFIWARRMGGTSNDIAYSVGTDALGNVYTCGYYFSSPADFDPGPGNYPLSPVGSADIFISSLDSAGNFRWARSMGGSNNEIGYELAVDAGGNVLSTGYFNATVDFDPSPSVFSLTSSGLFDVFVSKLDSSGNFVWAKKIGGTASEAGYSLATDNGSNIYLTGGFEGTADFDPGPGVYNMVPTGSADVFLCKLDAAGNFVCAGRMGGSGGALGYDLALDGSSGVVITGYFTGTTDFDPGPGTANLVPGGTSDAFVCRLSDCNPLYVQEQGPGYSLTVYPNPFSGDLFLEADEPGVIGILDLAGHCIHRQQAGAGISRIDMNVQPAGIYILEFRSAEGVIRRKVVKE